MIFTSSKTQAFHISHANTCSDINCTEGSCADCCTFPICTFPGPDKRGVMVAVTAELLPPAGK
jgi:hypothetical protein